MLFFWTTFFKFRNAVSPLALQLCRTFVAQVNSRWVSHVIKSIKYKLFMSEYCHFLWHTFTTCKCFNGASPMELHLYLKLLTRTLIILCCLYAYCLLSETRCFVIFMSVLCNLCYCCGRREIMFHCFYWSQKIPNFQNCIGFQQFENQKMFQAILSNFD